MIDKIIVKKRALTHQEKITRVIDILENCKFDIVYMDNLKQPLNDYEFRYFQDQVARINGAIHFLTWFRDNMIIKERKSFWERIWKKKQ